MAKYRPIGLDYVANLKFARAIAESAGLNVKFFDPSTDEFPVPRTDSKTLYIPQASPRFTDDEWAAWYDVMFHEIGHNMPENRGTLKWLQEQKIDPQKSFFGNLLNITDDHRVDQHRVEKYRGMAQAHNHAYSDFMQAQDFKGLKEAAKVDKYAKALCAAMAFDTVARGQWNPGARGFEAKFIDGLDAEGLKWVEKLTDNYLDDYLECDNCEKTRKFTDRIMKEVFDFDPEEEKQQAKQASKPEPGENEEVEGEEVEAVAEDEGDEEGEGQGKDGGGDGDSDGKPQEGKQKPPKKGKSKVKYEDIVKLQHQHGDAGYSNSQLTIDYSTYKDLEEYRPYTSEETDVHDFSSNVPSRYRNSRRTSAHTINALTSKLNIPAMVNEARRLMQVMTRKRVYFNQKKGRIDGSKIYRVCVPDNPIAERIFKTKTESSALDTAVSILVDYSGSMGGYKVELAIASAAALESLCRMMRLNVEIAGFTEPGHKNAHLIFKPFNKPVNEASLIEYMCYGTSHMGGNADGDNILIAWERLSMQKQKRKILIVLSDGQPACSRGDAYNYTKNVIASVEKEPNSDIIGIGIHHDEVTRLYKHHHVINNLEQLPKALIQTLEHCIIDG